MGALSKLIPRHRLETALHFLIGETMNISRKLSDLDVTDAESALVHTPPMHENATHSVVSHTIVTERV